MHSKDLHQIIRPLRRSIALMVLRGEYDDAELLIAHTRGLEEAKCSGKAVAEIERETPCATRDVPGTGHRLQVALDGRAVVGPDAATVFARTLAIFGLERVYGLGMQLSGVPLVSKARCGAYQSLRQIDGWWVCTHSNTATKKRLLYKIAQRLDVRGAIVQVCGTEQLKPPAPIWSNPR